MTDKEYHKLSNDDEELNRTLNVLKNIHSRFYNENLNADVRYILPQLKSDVLNGCNLVFSGVIPINQPPEM